MVDPKPKEKKPRPTSVEREVAALRVMVENMKSLDTAAQTRVLSYLKARFGIYLGAD
jgi:hypothetical protein